MHLLGRLARIGGGLLRALAGPGPCDHQGGCSGDGDLAGHGQGGRCPRGRDQSHGQRLRARRPQAGPRAMTRTFLHSFAPAKASPVAGATVDLDVSEIEDAGIREVLQTPGAAYGAWSILDKLLTPTGTGTPFIFKNPLGHAREVKVALSGLFGRFVARAYLERYFQLSIFAHLGSGTISLDRRRQVTIKRLSRGDLPDWLACASNLSSLTVAEAKGCH